MCFLLFLDSPIAGSKQKTVKLVRIWELLMKVPGPSLAVIFVADEAAIFTSQGRWGISVNVSCFGKCKPARRCVQILFPLVCHNNLQRVTPSPPPTHLLLLPNEIQLLPQPSPSSTMTGPLETSQPVPPNQHPEPGCAHHPDLKS